MTAALILAGARIQASVLQSIAPLAVIKDTDQSVTSSTTLVDDTELLVPVIANATYLFDCFLDYEAASEADGLKWTWSVPTSSTLRYQAVFQNGGVIQGGSTFLGSTSHDADGAGAGNLMGVTMTGSLIAGSAGNLQLQWAQSASSGTAAIVHAQSMLTLWRVS